MTYKPFRLMRRSPAFTAVAVATFGLAIGTTTAVFSHVRATLLAPLPFPDPDRLVSVWPSGGSLARSSMAAHMYDAVRELSDTFTAVAAVGGQSENLTGSGEPERVQVTTATQSLQAVMGSPLAAGRWFLPDEDAPGRDRVAVLSHGFWMRRFGGDATVVGRTILLNAVPRVVVGIMGPQAPYPAGTDIWVPIAFTDQQRSLASRGSEYLTVIARLQPDVSHARARGALDAVGQRLRSLYGISVAWTLRSATLDDDLRGELRPIVFSTFGAVLLVFIVACANIANLLLVRASDRRREFAIRLAIGGSPSQIRVQALMEAGALAAVGGSAGMLFAAWLAPVAGRLAARAGVPLAAASIDTPVLLFGLAVTVASALLAGMLPSWQIGRVSLGEVLGRSTRGSTGAVMKPALVVAEIALAFVVVIGAALLTRSLIGLAGVDPGFTVEDRLTARVTLPAARYATRQQRDAFYQRLLADLRSLPGIRAAGAVSELPLSEQRNMASFDVDGRVVPPGDAGPHADMRSATAGYLEAMNITVLRGRNFSEGDTLTAPQIAIVDDTVAKRVFGADDPLGKRVALAIDPDGVWREIVGVVRSVHHDSLDSEIRGTVYVPLSQRPTRAIFAVVQADSNATALAPMVRAAVQRIDSDLPLYDIATLRTRLNDSMGRHEVAATMVGTFAATALILALTGVYAVIAFAVTQRSREIGVRMALGAQRAQVLWLFVRSTALTTCAGVAAGTLIAAPLMRAGSSLLFQVAPDDPATYGITAMAFIVLTTAISALSARRAASLDPMTVLRN